MKDGNMELKIARTRQRVCQYELSHRTGISQGLISLIERGYRHPTKVQAGKIAEALRINIEEIFPDLLLRWKNKGN